MTNQIRFKFPRCYLHVIAITLAVHGMSLGCLICPLPARQTTPTNETPITPAPQRGVKFVEPVDQYWRIGVRMKGGERTCKNILITIPVPIDWPEQSVKIIQKNVPGEVQRFEFRNTTPIVQQLVATIPTIRAGQEFEMTIDVKVTLSKIVAPDDTSVYKIPKTVPKELREYLEISPGISFRDAKLRNMVKEITDPEPTAWDQVRAISRWVQTNIQQEGEEVIETVQCFRDRAGSTEDLVCLFVAMCRAHKVPARMVWVEASQYAEFYLIDDTGAGHWFPCSLVGWPEFGSLSHVQMIDQKGDSFRIPEYENTQKYVLEFMTGEGANKPAVQFIRERIPAAELGVGKE
jgi:hypothetical protein